MHGALCTAISTALLAAEARGRMQERERCAKVAEFYERAEQQSHYRIIGIEIADAIRRGGSDAS